MSDTTTGTPKALLLDDDATVLRLLGTGLEARGVAVRAAGDAAAGLTLLLDELLELDVLVIDLELPGRDGFELLHLVRRAGGERDLRVVVLATDPGHATREQLYSLGADLVLNRRAGAAAATEAIAALAGPPARAGARGGATCEGALSLCPPRGAPPRLAASAA